MPGTDRRDHGHPVDESRQCEATVKGGYRQCLNPPIMDSSFCGSHGGIPEPTESEIARRNMLFFNSQGNALVRDLEPLERWAKRTPEDLVAALKVNRKGKEILDDVLPMLHELRRLL
jgi:hypothetical protein